jgi:uncharacterized protein (TIGR02270 family)
LLQACVESIGDEDPTARFWASWAAVLLGDRGAALHELVRMAEDGGPHSTRALALALQATTATDAHRVLQRLAVDPTHRRQLVVGSGLGGNPGYVPWLMQQMRNPETARAAGEAFTLITGADLEVLRLSQSRPDGFEAGPNDNPNDLNVDVDPDEGLLWPDVAKVEQWWNANSSRFEPGTRYFMGRPVTREHCIEVLKNGYQRQRILAAHYLCLLNPGTPLFNTSAPAWRQQRLLAEMK